MQGWLVQRGKIDEAEKVLAMTHKGVSGYDVKEELVRDPTHTKTLSDTRCSARCNAVPVCTH